MAVLRRGVGKRIQQLRKAAGFTQETLATLANVDSKYLGSIERGEKSPSLEVLEKLILALKVEPYEPFMFTLKARKQQSHLGDEALLNLIRRSDRKSHSLLLQLAEVVLTWGSARKDN